MNRPVPIQVSKKYFSDSIFLPLPNFRDFNFSFPAFPDLPNFERPNTPQIFTDFYSALLIGLVTDNLDRYLDVVSGLGNSLLSFISREQVKSAREYGRAISVFGSKFGFLNYLPDSGAYQDSINDLLLKELEQRLELERKIYSLFLDYRAFVVNFVKSVSDYNEVLLDLYAKDLSFYEKFFKEFWSVVVDNYLFELVRFNFSIEFSSLIFDLYEKILALKGEYLNLLKGYQRLYYENVEYRSLLNKYEEVYTRYRNKVEEMIKLGIVDLEVLRMRREAELKKFSSDIKKAEVGMKYVKSLMDIYKGKIEVVDTLQQIEKEKLGIFETQIGLKRKEIELNEKEVSVAFSSILKELAIFEKEIRVLEIEMEKYLKEYEKDLLIFKERALGLLEGFYQNYDKLVEWFKVEASNYLTNRNIVDDYIRNMERIVTEYKIKDDVQLDIFRLLVETAISVNRTYAISCSDITSRIIRSLA